MGKQAKSARSLKRKMAKQAQRAARRALYESYRGTGANKKSKRFVLGNRRSKNSMKLRATMLIPVLIRGEVVMAIRAVHASNDDCGNTGCQKCHNRYK